MYAFTLISYKQMAQQKIVKKNQIIYINKITKIYILAISSLLKVRQLPKENATI